MNRRPTRRICDRIKLSVDTINEMDKESVPTEIAFKHKEWLKDYYYEKEMSESDIAEITGCTRKNIEYWMEKFGLNRRDKFTRNTERFKGKISETSKGRVHVWKGKTKHDDPSIMKRSLTYCGENSHMWKGGTYVTSSGYKFKVVKGHPCADKDGYVAEHRLVAEFVLGRLLDRTEVVHHRDFNRKNNFIYNLYIFPDKKAHTSYHNYVRFVNPKIVEEEFMEGIYSG
jgi:hypothetical protein